jgi:hypothetical protein
MKHGKKLYKSTALKMVKVLAILISFALFFNLYAHTVQLDIFLKEGWEGRIKFWAYHLANPAELLTYILFVLLPALYYGFIRGVVFFEKGILYNKGLPTFNSFIPYSDIKSFEVISQKHFMSIKSKSTDDEILFSINDMDRVVAILDQNGIKGSLGLDIKKDMAAHKKLGIFFILVGALMYMIQYFGVVRLLFG